MAVWLDGRRLISFRWAAQRVASLCDGLEHAHERGVLHRDIKPSNVLLDPLAAASAAEWPFVPRLADFGIARLLAGDERATRTTAVVGTVAYMAPEQAVGRTEMIGHAADIYSVGAILYEVLTARLPIEGDTELDLLRNLPTEAPPALRRFRAAIPRDPETICLKCLESKPERRYSSAGELAADLRRFIAGQPIQARPVGPLERGLRWCQRKPAIAAPAASIGAAGAILAPVIVIFTWRLQGEVERVGAAERRSNEHLWDAQLAAAAGRRQSGLAGQRLESMEMLGRAATLAGELDLGDDARRRLRDESCAALALSDLRRANGIELPLPAGHDRAIAVDAAFSRAVVRDGDGRVSLVDLRGAAPLSLGVVPRGRM